MVQSIYTRLREHFKYDNGKFASNIYVFMNTMTWVILDPASRPAMKLCVSSQFVSPAISCLEIGGLKSQYITREGTKDVEPCNATLSIES